MGWQTKEKLDHCIIFFVLFEKLGNDEDEEDYVKEGLNFVQTMFNRDRLKCGVKLISLKTFFLL
jgi:hypothetical protein